MKKANKNHLKLRSEKVVKLQTASMRMIKGGEKPKVNTNLGTTGGGGAGGTRSFDLP